MAATPQPGTLDLVDDGTDDLRLRWGRDWSIVIRLVKTAPSTYYDFTSDILISVWSAQIRTADADETLICTGSVTYTSIADGGAGDGSDGRVTVTFPSNGWATTGECDCSAKWDLVGSTSGNNDYQFVEGRADVLRTVTVVP